ncbi:MAG: phosphate acetyltransferase [Coriobacteriales bacterium]|nr:phosphate acetyltransferase [Coriobacteriales bacterium]
MSDFLLRTIKRAAANKKRIVLPEGADVRTIKAALEVNRMGFADVVVLGSADAIGAHGLDVSELQIIDPADSSNTLHYASILFELRKDKGLTYEQASKLVLDELYYGVMMVHAGDADGMVAGAAHATSDVLRPCLQILKTAPGTTLVSAFFVMVVPDCDLGKEGAFIFADSGLVQHPDSEQLAQIALSSATSFKTLLEDEPIVAMLSHSTMGSAKSPSVSKVAEAVTIAKNLNPQLALDGEFQLDAAIIPEIGASKAPGSAVAGRANVLVFPDLDSGNIGYKLTQRLAKAEAYGPITQGIAKPVNDLSRGCSAEDIVGVIAITAVQAGTVA